MMDLSQIHRLFAYDGDPKDGPTLDILSEDHDRTMHTIRSLGEMIGRRQNALEIGLDRLPLGLCVWMLSGRGPESFVLKRANRAASLVWGMDLANHIGDHIGDLFPSMLTDGTAARWKEALDTEASLDSGTAPYHDDRISAVFRSWVVPLPSAIVAVLFERIDRDGRLGDVRKIGDV